VKTVFAHCRFGCKARLLLHDIDGQVPVKYVSNPTVVLEPINAAIPYLVWCVAHHEVMRGKPIRVKHSSCECDDRCTKATGETCNCSCGGINHGSEAI